MTETSVATPLDTANAQSSDQIGERKVRAERNQMIHAHWARVEYPQTGQVHSAAAITARAGKPKQGMRRTETPWTPEQIHELAQATERLAEVVSGYAAELEPFVRDRLQGAEPRRPLLRPGEIVPTG